MLTLWYTNADTLTKDKLRELKQEIASGTPPDIIAITELKPKNYRRELTKIEYKIEGYRFEPKNLEDRGTTRGIALYIRDSIICSEIDTSKIIPSNAAPPKEVICFEMKLQHNQKLLFCNIYRSPNSSSEENKSINTFFENLNNLQNEHIIVVGDFNRKDINWESENSPSEDDRKFIEATRDSFLIQHVSTPTRGRGTNEPTLLDLVFTTDEESLEDIEISNPLGKSDHSMLKIQYRSQAEKMPDKVVCDYKKADFKKMIEILDIDWSNYFSDCDEDIDKVWKKFMEKYTEAEKECIPRKTIATGKKKFSYLLDRKTLSKRKKKYRLWKRYLETKDGTIYTEYCRCRNQLRRLTRNAVKIHENNIAKNTKSNSKLFWKHVNSKTKLRPSIPELYTSPKSKDMTSDDKGKAEILGKFFSSVYVKEPDWSWNLDNQEKPIITEELKLEITKDIILKKITDLNPNKSPGPDLLHPHVVKSLGSALVNPLYHIYNLSMRTGKIPADWKICSISAIFKKKGSRNCAENYRPVSLSSIACKILESIVKDAVLDYLKANNLLSKKQFGFLPGRSTVLQLLNVVHRWIEILEKGGIIDTIYCDFMKAFDTVPHNRLMDLLAHYGFKGEVLSWIKDFLSDRKQHVTVNGEKSTVFEATSGVPQGSVLGPILFVIFINSMVEKAGSSEMFLYADDLKIFKDIKSEEDVTALQQDLDNLYDWTRYSCLRFHPDKCISMRYKLNKRDEKCYYNMDETLLKTVRSEKDLGIIFENDLSFESHIAKQVKKANSLAGMIRRSFTNLDPDIFKKLFCAIVRPHLEYGAPVWNPHFKNQIELIENVQRRSSKLVPGLSSLTYKERLEKLEMPTLKYRRYRGDMIEVYKLSHGYYDENSNHFIQFRDNRDHDIRGHKFNIYKERYSKDIGKFSFKGRVTNQWNNLPDVVVEAPSLNSFKNRIDELWKSKGVIYDPDCDINITTSLRNTRYARINL